MEKPENKEDSADDQKKVDYSIYAEQPEKLFPIAQDQFNKNKFEEGLDILEQAIMLAIKKFGGEDKVDLALFYNKYADGLIQKLMITNNEDFLNIQEEGTQEAPEEKDDQSSKKEKPEKKEENKDENNNNIKEEEKAPKDNNENVGDEEIIYENLNAANLLLKTFLKNYDDKDPKTLDKSINKYYIQLCDNYSLFASLEKINSDFKKADEYFKLSIDICRKYEDKFSRTLAGLYFEQSQILDFDPKNCLLSLYKSKVIMEYYLQKEIDKANLKVKLDIDEKDLDLNELSFESEKIFKNKDIIMNDEELNNAAKLYYDIEDFMNIIKDINIKLEDVVLELKEYDLFLKTKEQMKKDGEKQNAFNTNIDMSKVIDLEKVALIKKKRKAPDTNDEGNQKKEDEVDKNKKKKTE